MTFDLLQCWHPETCACQANSPLLSPEPHPQTQVWASQIGTPSSFPFKDSHVSLSVCPFVWLHSGDVSAPLAATQLHTPASAFKRTPGRCLFLLLNIMTLTLHSIVSGPRTLPSNTTRKAAAGRGGAKEHLHAGRQLLPPEVLHLFPQSGVESGCLISHCLCVCVFLRVRHSLTPVVLGRWMECWGPGLCMEPAPSY